MTHLHQDAIDLFGVQFLPSRWIERIRSQPRLVEAVLADVGSMAKEGRVRTTTSQAAENLWQMWNTETADLVEKSL